MSEKIVQLNEEVIKGQLVGVGSSQPYFVGNNGAFFVGKLGANQ